MALNLTNALPEPHSHIGDNLLVSAASSVKFSTNLLTNDLRQSSLIRGMNLYQLDIASKPRDIE